MTSCSPNGWDGFGIAIQAYQKRAAPLCDWVVELRGRTAAS